MFALLSRSLLVGAEPSGPEIFVEAGARLLGSVVLTAVAAALCAWLDVPALRSIGIAGLTFLVLFCVLVVPFCSKHLA